MYKTIFVTGVSGSGKSTIGKRVADALGHTFHDGDDFHPPANVTKMSSGQALNDSDRAEWLKSLNELAQKNENIVVACSALKRKYRAALQEQLPSDSFVFIHLVGSYDLILSRIKARTNHFMPETLLKSQFDDYEEPTSGHILDINDTKDNLTKEILLVIKQQSEFGLIGLGVMGTSLARNIGRNKFKLSLYNRRIEGKEEEVAEKLVAQHKELATALPFEDLQQFVDSLASPKKIMLMVSAGKAVDFLINELTPLLQKGDLIIDGGNSHYDDTQRRHDLLQDQGILYIGTGVSGGEKGALLGPAVMPGGSAEAYGHVKEILESISAAAPSGGHCCKFIGKGGSGHFVKMVHNGIEYGEMQLIAECYQLLRYAKGLSSSQIAEVFQKWYDATEASYLLEITIKILKEKNQNGELYLDQILDKAGNKGTGSWTTISACNLGVAIPTLTAALFARYQSALKDERASLASSFTFQNKSSDWSIEDLLSTYALARIMNHRQGLKLIEAASQEYDWNIQIDDLLIVWSAGCIIRSTLLERIRKAYQNQDFITAPEFTSLIVEMSTASRPILAAIAYNSYPSPCLTASIDYYKYVIQSDSSANVIQAQRDFFGAHTFKWKLDPKGPSAHHNWEV